MTDEDHSQPFAAPTPTMTSMVNAVIALSAETKALREATSDLKSEVRDLRQERTRWVTREELAEHASQCAGNPRGRHSRRPTSGNVPRIGIWAAAQQRLGVVMSILTLLSLVGGAWWWSVKAAGDVRERLKVTERKQRQRDDKIERQVRANLHEVLKAMKSIKEGDGE